MIMKKITALLLTVILLFAPAAVAAFADFENTHENTGDMAADIIAVAETQLGYMEGSLGGTVQGSNDCTKYGEWYGLNYQPWCAMFVSWCADQAGVPTHIVPRHASCDVGMNWFKDRGRWQYSPYYGGGYTPKQADIISFGYKDGSEYDATHVGIVYSVDDEKVTVLEGNSSAKVQTVSYKLGISYILGYGTPGYTVGDPGADPFPPGIYRVLASSLNVRDNPGVEDSQVIALRHEDDEVEVVEVANEYWGRIILRDGSYGWISLRYCELVRPYSADKYEIVFDANGGSGAPSPVYVVKGETAVIPDVTPERDGFDFLGWSEDMLADSPGYVPGDSLTPEADIRLYATWGEEELPGILKVTDINDAAWYYAAVCYCYEKGYMAGVSETEFRPSAELTRAMFVTVLAKVAEADLDAYDDSTDGLPFDDVVSSWYIKPLKWAYENGFTAGKAADKFGTSDPITREQLALMLMHVSEKLGSVGEPGDPELLERFEDFDTASSWATEGLAWACANGIISGIGDRLTPRGTATRAQVAQMIYKLTYTDVEPEGGEEE